MRKFLSLCLSLVMLLALTLPAAAYTDTEPPLWQRMGYGSLSACLDIEEITEEQYGILAERSAGFDPNAYYASEYGYYEGSLSAQEYMDYWELDEAAFAQTMFEEWFHDQTYAFWLENYQEEARRQLEEARNKAIQDAGGVPGQVNVMLNGKCLSFGKAAPEIVSGRTMVPMRAILESLGAQVAYDGDTKTATVTLGETVLTHVIGETTISTAAGETLQMKAASYIKSGRTMVPLRFFSEALGYDVFWDADYRTAVLIDKAALIAGMDSHYTILNDYMQKQYAALDMDGRNLEAKAVLDGDVLIYDTINGNKKHHLDIDISALLGQEGIDISGKMDLSLVLDLLKAVDSEEEIPAWLTAAMKDITFQVIADKENVWLYMPILVQFMREQGVEDIPKGDVWFQSKEGMDLESLYLSLGALQAQAKEMTIGQIVYQTATRLGSPFRYYQTIGDSDKGIELLMGDKTFTKSGSNYKWKLDQETINKRSKEFKEIFLTDEIDFPMSIELTLKANGGCDFSMKGEYGYGGETAAKFTIAGTSTTTKGTMTVKVQVKNVCDVDLKLESTVQPTTKAPASKPPANAVIIDEDYSAMPLPA